MAREGQGYPCYQHDMMMMMMKTLLAATTPGQMGPKSDGNEEVLCIPQSSSITGASPSDFLVSYPGHSLAGSYYSAEIQSVYSTVLIDWAEDVVRHLSHYTYDTTLLIDRSHYIVDRSILYSASRQD